MDAPIASLVADGFLKGYEKQAKKEEKEAAKRANDGLCSSSTSRTCIFDGGENCKMKKTPYKPVLGLFGPLLATPNAMHQTCHSPEKTGAAILQLFNNERKKDELKADLALQRFGITPKVHHFFENVSPFFAVTIVDEILPRSAVKGELDMIFNKLPLDHIYGPATLLRKKLREEEIYGVAICNWHDAFSYQRGRTIAKGRLAKHLKERSVTRENNNKIRELLKQGYIYDDPPRALTEEQRVSVREWYKTHKRYLEI